MLVFEDDAEAGFVRDDLATTNLLTPLLMAEEPPEDAQRLLAGGAQEQLQHQEQQQVGEVVREGHGAVGCSFHLAKAILGVGECPLFCHPLLEFLNACVEDKSSLLSLCSVSHACILTNSTWQHPALSYRGG